MAVAGREVVVDVVRKGKKGRSERGTKRREGGREHHRW
jgi:hypothetical protein